MADKLDIHPASADEILAAHRNVFDIWSKGLPLEEHLRYRLDSPSHRRATWFVGTLDKQVVVSLGCYPVRFRMLGEELPGIAIGSVYTLGEFRGRGFAPRLLAWVEEHEERRQAALSVLYSDIDPNYYARLGYALCPSWEGWCQPSQIARTDHETARLTPFSPRENLARMAELYHRCYGRLPLSIARDAEYWSAMLDRFADDAFYSLSHDGREWAGYVRIVAERGAWRIRDFAIADLSEPSLERLYRSVLSLAKAAGVQRLGGWMSDSAATKKFFPLTARRTEITMVKPLAWAGTLSPEMITAAGQFCELDHV